MAHPDLNALKDTLYPIAKKMLAEHGEFFPCGAFVKLDGKIVHCAFSDGDEHPASQKVIDMLTAKFGELASRREIRAAGICFDVRVATKDRPQKLDALQFALEHTNGESVNVFIPYDLDGPDEPRFGEIFASLRDRQFFL